MGGGSVSPLRRSPEEGGIPSSRGGVSARLSQLGKRKQTATSPFNVGHSFVVPLAPVHWFEWGNFAHACIFYKFQARKVFNIIYQSINSNLI